MIQRVGPLYATLTLVLVVGNAANGDIISSDGSSYAVKYNELIAAGDPEGDPEDSPADHIDQNLPSSPYAGVGSIFIGLGDGSGNGYIVSGTLISPRHVLTAGHAIDLDDNGIIDVAPGNVRFFLNYDGNFSHDITASALAIHPDFGGFDNPDGVVNDDLAILTLSQDLPANVPIYPLLTTPLSLNSTLTHVGYGQSGDGVNGYTVDAGFSVKRVGQNNYDDFDLDDDPAQSGEREVYYFDFDGPDFSTNLFGDDTEANGTLDNDVETTLGGGDSGGPAFFDDNGTLKLAAVNTFTFTVDGGPDAPFYGSGGGGILLHSYLSWINATVAIPEVSSLLLVGAVALLTGAMQSRRRRRVS